MGIGKDNRTNAKSSFWQKIDLGRQDAAQDNIDEAAKLEDKADFLAPSPVKVKDKGKGKGKQRLIEPLLGENELPPNAEAKDLLAFSMNANTSLKAGGSAKASKLSFFSGTSALPPLKADDRDVERPKYIPPPVKPKKRTSEIAALVPFDNLGEPDDEPQAGALPVVEEGRSASPDERAMKKRPKRDLKQADIAITKASASETSDAGTSTSANRESEAEPDIEEEEVDDNYELRDMVEYEPYDPHSRRSATPAVSAEAHNRRSVSTVPEVDEPLDPQLVSLLSLKTSPVKNRLAKLHKKRDDTVQKLLQEPTYLIAQKKALATQGLEDLEDDQHLSRKNRPDEMNDTQEEAEQSEDEAVQKLAENSDDDWASEPDGWKDLGDGEMDYDDL